MRDPLARVPVRWKLVAGLVGLCLLAYLVTSWLVSSSARAALREQILARLTSDSEARAVLVRQALDTTVARARDFASDGFVRAEAERLATVREGPPSVAEADVLSPHLRDNKLPVAPTLSGLTVTARDPRRLAGAGEEGPVGVPFPEASEPVVGRFEEPEGRAIRFAVHVPVESLDRARRVGWLVAWVDAGRWFAEIPLVGAPGPDAPAVRLLDGTGAELVRAAASDGSAPRLVLRPAAPVPRARDGGLDDGRFERAWPVSSTGWTVVVSLDASRAFAPAAGLDGRFLGAGLLVAAMAGLLLFAQMRFLARPLGALADAARRLAAGESSARVEIDTQDEVGELGRAFNGMADAIADRTERLEHAATDLAARKDDLARERDRLDAMVHSMQDPLLFFDDEGRVVLSNAAAAPLLPLLSGGAARDLALLCARGDDPSGRAERDCVACLSRGLLPRQTCRLEVGTRVYEVLATRIPSSRGWLGRLLVARDITAIVTLDEQQARQERLAVLGEVAAVVAHELNNPLAAIGMYAQMMQDELPADSPFREHADVVRRNTEACARTIRGLLDWAWSAEPEAGETDVHEVVEEALRFLRPLLQRAHVTVGSHLGLPDPIVFADALQLRQVVVNLLMNAAQATEGVGGRVEVETAEEAVGGGVRIDVRDDGPGVPQDRRDRIFEPFFTTKPAGKGTGLGLPISRRIVEAHGGTLELAESRPGRTVFRVRLPRRALVTPRRPAPASAASGLA